MPTQEAQALIHEISAMNIDECIKTSGFTNEVEESIRGHIHQELVSWMVFRKLSMSATRANVCLLGFAQLYERCAFECLMDAHWLEKYLVQRGGRSKPTPIEVPPCDICDTPVEPINPVREALNTEKRLLEDLQRLMGLAEKTGNFALAATLDRRFLCKMTRHVKDWGDLLQQTVRVSKDPGHGIYHLDRELREKQGVIPWTHLNDPDETDRCMHHVGKGEPALAHAQREHH
ncbi:hypothetical protein VTN31DRAFT_2041 [Thermomyces dupontii]|uniref:uncharacterized protein n=1 Tax=Talaromyces thermophilus TaxID=28565 RepID=UPI0037447DCE